MKQQLLLGLSALVVAGCGGGVETASQTGNGCPPAVKNAKSLTVSGRYEGGIAALTAWNKWHDTLPPSSCAGQLGKLLPSLPEGFGVAPGMAPPIMSENHIYITYGRMPEGAASSDIPPAPIDNEIIDIELVIWSDDEMKNFDSYIANGREGRNYLKYNLNGQPVYSIAEFGAFPTTDKMSRGLMIRFPGNLVAKVFHKDIYASQDDILAEPSVFKDILLELQS